MEEEVSVSENVILDTADCEVCIVSYNEELGHIRFGLRDEENYRLHAYRTYDPHQIEELVSALNDTIKTIKAMALSPKS